MKFMFASTFVAALLLLSSCLTTTEKRIMAPPWTPTVADEAALKIKPPIDEIVPVYWDESEQIIDGKFEEWENLTGPVTRVVVFGSYHDPEDAEAGFVLKTDGKTLYIYSNITDDVVNENELQGSMAWRSDSVEIFFGTDTSIHTGFRMSDNLIRIVPKNRLDPFDYELSINDISQNTKTEAAIVFTEKGYELEMAIPLNILQIESLKPGQKIKCEFQINDADTTERDRLVHWMSEHDDPWYDASVWGRGQVTK